MGKGYKGFWFGDGVSLISQLDG